MAALLPEPCAQVRALLHEWRDSRVGRHGAPQALGGLIGGRAGAAAVHVHAATADVVAAAAPTAREARRAVVVSKSLRCWKRVSAVATRALRSPYVWVGPFLRVSLALWSA